MDLEPLSSWEEVAGAEERLGTVSLEFRDAVLA